jgi:sulfate/thiosulfate transport system ATP-binding protein
LVLPRPSTSGPQNPFVAQFLGQVNILPLETIQPGSRSDSRTGLALLRHSSSPDAQIYVRPHDLEILRKQDDHPCWNARVERLTPLGGIVRVGLSIDPAHRIHIELSNEQAEELELSKGEAVLVAPRHVNVFDPHSHSFSAIALNHSSRVTA